MAFYGERFRRPDEEDIWEELRQMLANPPSEQEIMQKKKAEQAWIDSVLEQAFPDEPKVQKEPYLTYEELMEGIDDKTPNGQATGMAVGVNNLNEFKTPSELLEELPSKDDLKKVATEMGFDTEKVLSKENLKKAAGYGLMGASIIPATSGAASGGKITGAIAKGLSPKLGRKIAQQIARGTISGAVAGGVEGLGRGLVNDENVINTTLQDAAIGGLLGGAGGAISGKAGLDIHKKKVDELLDKRKDWGIAFTKQSGKPEEAIEKLLEQKQGFVPNATSKKGVGNIDFVWGDSGKGLQHIIERRNNEGLNGEKYVREIPQLIENSKVYNKTKHLDRKYIGDQKKEIAVKTEWNKKPRNWIVSSYNLEKAPSQALPGGRALEQTYANGQQISPLDLRRTPNDIVKPFTQNLNPSASNMQQNNIHPQNMYNGAQNNQQIPILESEEEWLKRLRRQRQRMGLF